MKRRGLRQPATRIGRADGPPLRTAMENAVTGPEMFTECPEDELDAVTPRLCGGRVPLFGDPSSVLGDRLDFQLAAVLSSASASDEDEVPEVESFILDQEVLDNPVLKTASELFLSTAAEEADFRTVDPETQARLEALLEAAAFADPEVLRRLTSSVSCALDEAAAALTRMRADNSLPTGEVDNRSLAEACSDGDVNAVRKLLNEGRNVNEHTEEGDSLLCLACSAGYYELAQVLLAMHANVEDRGNKGDITPLMAAASGGFVDIVKLLLAHSADVNAQSSTGNTALTYACGGGYVDVVQVLLKEGANIEDHNENGHTPLMEAASAGHIEVAKVLLENGAGINTHSNEFKESALTLACYKGHLEMVRFLLEAGADQEHKTDEMHTALMEACMDGHVAVARLLLDSGAQVNMPADSFESPLTLAACGGHVELAALLIERGANLEEVNDEGYTPLMESAREGHEEIVALLLAQGANINAQTEETQETALTLACCGGFAEVADFLIKAGADIELGCSTPLMEAAQEGHLELVKYLLAAGANVHAKTATGDTALTYACENGHTDVADVLLQAGADLEHESEGGRTPLMKAARAGHLCTIQFLISKGANVNRATVNNDHTVMSLACAGGHLAVVELLLSNGADPTHRLKDGSTMLIEAAKGGHTNVVSYLLDYPKNLLAQSADVGLISPPSQDQVSVSRVPMHALAMVLSPQDQEKPTEQVNPGALKQMPPNLTLPEHGQKSPFHPYHPLECIVEETEGKLNELGQRISAIEKAQLKSLELIQGEPLNKDKIEELKKNREEQVQKKKKILKELQKVERQLQMKTQQQIAKEGLEPAAGKDSVAAQGCTVTCASPVGDDTETPAEENCSVLRLCQDAEHTQLSHLTTEHNGFIPIHSLPPSASKPPNALEPSTMDSPEPKINSSYPDLNQTPIFNEIHSSQVTDGLMVASPAQTIDDLMTAVNNRVPPLPFNSPPATLPSSAPQTSPVNAKQPLLSTFPSVDIDAHTESNHDTALTLGCAGGHEELVSVLIARCANIEHRDKKGSTPLILAATAGHVGIVETLLDKGADIEAQTERTKDTPLSLACSGGRQEVVELLLARGANKEHRNVSDYTPLSLAASGGYVNIIKILLNAGAEINSRTGSKLGISPLMLAAMNGHVPAVKLLLDMGSDINAQIETNRNTALTLACFQGRAEVVSLLLDRKANVEHRAKTGLTPLMEAASGGYAEVGRVLLDKGADVNSPPVPSSRDTALTIAADKGHYKFCELLINRGSHIDVRNKKGNTPIWLAANGGHFDVVQLLVQAAADVDAADNRKITPLMSAFRKGHLKVVQYLVKQVNQFPSDTECMRYIATITDKDLLKKCHQCMETIVKAKDQQAAKANKNASILLKELDLEKSREESRKQALAAKREKRKEKRKKKKEEQKKKVDDDEDGRSPEAGNLLIDDAQDDDDDDDDALMEPPSATTTTTIGISASSPTFTNAFGKRGKIITPSAALQNKKNKTKETSSDIPVITLSQHLSTAQQKVDATSLTGETTAGDSVNGSSDSDNTADYSNSDNRTGDPTQKCRTSFETNVSAGKSSSSFLLHTSEEKTKASVSKLSTRFEKDVNYNTLPCCKPFALPNMKLNLSSPKRGQRREEGWKEVVRRSKKLSVPASVVSRIMGRGGCNITAIQDVTGAHIDVDKQKDKNGERMITIRGGTESTRYAIQLINSLIQDPAKELEDLIPKSHIRNPRSIAHPSNASSIKAPFSIGATAVRPPQATILPSLQPSSRPNKSPQANVNPSFPGTFPLSYASPHFALFAAQTMQQNRQPNLPLAQFAGTCAAPSSWGPFSLPSGSPSNGISASKHIPVQTAKQISSMALTDTNTRSSLGGSVSAPPAAVVAQQMALAGSPPSAGKHLFSCNFRSNPVASMGSTASNCSCVVNPAFPTTGLKGAASSTASNETEHGSDKAITVSTTNGESSFGINSLCIGDQIPDQPALKPSVQQNLNDGGSSNHPERYEPMMPDPIGRTQAVSNRPEGAEHHPNSRIPQIAPGALHDASRAQFKSSLHSGTPSSQKQQQYAQTVFGKGPEPHNIQDALQPLGKQSALPAMSMSNSQTNFDMTSKLPPLLEPQLLDHFSSLFYKQLSCLENWEETNMTGRVSDPPLSSQPTYLGSAVLGHGDSSNFGSSPGSYAIPYADAANTSSSSSSPSTSVSANNHTSEGFLHVPSAGAPNFSRQHFSPHPWMNPSNTCEPLVQTCSSGQSPPLTSVSAPPVMCEHSGNLPFARKMPPPIGTERLARIRQTAFSPTCALGTSFSASVGHSGIWSFGANSESDVFPGWTQQVVPDNSLFSQPQLITRDESALLNQSSLFHQAISNPAIDFSKGAPFSTYGGKMTPCQQQLPEMPGGPIFNMLHSDEAAWNPLYKVTSTPECTDSHKVWPRTWTPHIGTPHLKYVN
ncbi:ankyrin repeat and KH domain-containing protein 1-like isoform X2 [Hyperolius riggenbachi]|uniref:ankyrin repeat and KH domain-containing protein 1-like isoform X2 n=1 Tax=Hyperolius riggenbachi TaxID=752182 RepID=UPI0035A300F9